MDQSDLRGTFVGSRALDGWLLSVLRGHEGGGDPRLLYEPGGAAGPARLQRRPSANRPALR